MGKTKSAIAIAASAVLLLTGCGQGSGSGGGTDAEAGDGGGTLVVSTNSNSEGRGEWLEKAANDAGFDIQIVGAGGADATNKLIAEKNNPVADVVYGLNNVYFEQLKTGGVLEPYTPAWSGDVDSGLGDPGEDKAYWPLVEQAIVLTYNKAAISPDEAPVDWPDLWTKEEFQPRYERVTGMGQATTQLVMAGILSRYRDENGDLGVSDEGWQQIEQYFQHGVPQVKDLDLFARFADGEVDLGQMPTSSIPGREEAYNVKSGSVAPDIGVPYAVEQVGIIKGSEKQEQARKFVDWFGSAEVQGQWAQEFDSLPVNQVALKEAKADIVKFNEQFKRQDIDWAFVQENLGAWIEKIELEYMQ